MHIVYFVLVHEQLPSWVIVLDSRPLKWSQVKTCGILAAKKVGRS